MQANTVRCPALGMRMSPTPLGRRCGWYDSTYLLILILLSHPPQLDTTLYAASINVTKLFTHQGGPLALQSSSQLNHGGLSLYDMWYPVENVNGPVKVFPSYAAYLFVAEMLGTSGDLQIANLYPGRQANGSTITPALGDTSEGQISVYGLWDEAKPEYPSKFAVLNLEIYNVTQVSGR